MKNQPIRHISAGETGFAINIFRKMAFVRAFESSALALSKTTPATIVGSMHLCAGQEAVPLGALEALGPQDKVIATYRGHGWALAAGLEPESVMAELCHRESGINGGRAGSALFMAPSQRFIGENSIVGAGVPIACGVAMAEVAKQSGNIVIVSIGDGALNQGSVHEALVFASNRKLPVLLVVENNGWSEYTPTKEIVALDRLSQRARAYGIPGTTIDGTDPIAVRDTIAIAAVRARAGEGPALIECRVPRLWGHYNRDIEHYRSKQDKLDAEARDPLILLRARLVASGVVTDKELSEIVTEEERTVEGLVETVLKSPRASADTAVTHVIGATDAVRNSSASATSVAEMTYIAAVNEALRSELASDERTVFYGEDVAKSGGIFGAAKTLHRDFGDERVFDTPIAESAILGSAVGAALNGLKPIVEIMWADFMLVAFDQLVNQAANVRYITRGQNSVPMVVRTQQGATPGSCAQHSQCLEAMLVHVPGLKVCLPATAQDAYDLIREAAADPDPCIVIEARGLYGTKSDVMLNGPVSPAGRARLHRSGKDIAIISWGAMVHHVLAASEELSAQGVNPSVLDLRWLNPLDESAVKDVVHKANGRVLIVHEAVRTGGFGGELLARIGEICTDVPALEMRRLTTPDVRIPAAPHLQSVLIPHSRSIVEAAHALVKLRGQTA